MRNPGYGVRHACVVADADYGDNPNFLDGLEQRREHYVVAVRRDFAVVGNRRRAEPSRRAEALLEALPPSAWRTIRWREGSRGWLRGRFAAVRCWRVTSDGRRHLGWLIGEREAADQERRRKYYWSNFGPGMPLAQRVEYAHRRHQVERFHEEAKGLLGWDQYQGRLWPGFHRHAVTVMLGYSFLVWREWQQRQVQRRRGRPRRPFSPSAGSPPRAPTRDPSPRDRLAAERGTQGVGEQGVHRSIPAHP